MDGSQSGKTELSTVPIPVEESRAQRLQRSQARFRDRGGIFVPTTRNTLVDILLGRKVATPKKVERSRSASLSPKKGRGRSVSVSPKKKGVKSSRNKDAGDATIALRTSPRKAAQRQMQAEQSEAGPSRLPIQSTESKAKPETTKKATKGTTSRVTASSKGKAKAKSNDSDKPAAKRRGRPPKTDIVNSDPVVNTPTERDALPPTTSKQTVKKPPVKRSTKKAEKAEDEPATEPPPKPKPKRVVKATTKHVSTTAYLSSFRASPSTSKSKATSKKGFAPIVTHESEPVKTQRSKGPESSKSNNALGSDDAQHHHEGRETHAEASDEVLEARASKAKGKGRPPRIAPTVKSSVNISASPTAPQKRARPDQEPNDYSPPKRAKVALQEEVKRPATIRKAPSRTKKASKAEVEVVIPSNEDVAHPPSKKRARDADSNEPAKRAKTRGAIRTPVEAVSIEEDMIEPTEVEVKGKKAEKAKKLPKVPRTNKSAATKAFKSDKQSSKAEPGVIFITRLRPRESVMIRLNQPELLPLPQITNNDPDPIDFLH
ncbi:hypothetical protein C0991_005794 [Blastosporella zonata]|nr:hypothetical protein C0991_005794 [Blastosporella zonata]